MNRKCVFSLGVVTVMAITSATALAQLPTCAQLNTDPAFGLAGNAVVILHSTTLVPAVGPNSRIAESISSCPSAGDRRSATPLARFSGSGCAWGCRLTPLMAAQAAGWMEKAPGMARSAIWAGAAWSAVWSGNGCDERRYVGSSTDSGHAGMDPAFGVIQAAHRAESRQD